MSIIYDDVVLENVSTKAFPIFDIDSVEVLRGPQGTLFGRNTPAGVVKFESRRPSREASGYIDVSYGRYNFRNVEAAYGGPVSDTVATRVSILYNGRDDWIDNIAPGFEDSNAFGGFEEVAARAQILWTPSEQTSVLLNAGYHNQFQGSQTGFRAGTIGIGEGFIGVDRDKISWDSLSRSASELEQTYFTGRVDHSFGDLTLTSITGYRSIIDNTNQGDVDGGSLTGPFFPGNVPFLRDVLGFGENWALETGDNITDHEQITQEIRLSSDTGGPFDWLAGFYYFYEDVAISQVNAASFPAFGAPPLTVPPEIARQLQETNAWAVFGSVDYAFTDRLKAKAGIRYSSDDKEHVFECTPANGNTPFPCPTAIETDVDDSEVTGDFSLTYALNQNVNVYGRISRGYKAPSILARDSVPDIGDAETILSYEAGVKSELLDNSLRLNFSGFYYRMSDQQLPVTGGERNTIGLVNADTTIGYGFETDLEFSPNDAVLLTAGLSLNETEIDDPDLGITVCGANCTVLDPVNPAIPSQRLIDGNSLPNAPKWMGNATLRLSQPMRGGELYVLTDWFFRSSNRTTLYEAVEFESGTRVEGGLRFGYVAPGGDYEVSVFGRNITDEKAPVAILGFFDFNGETMTGSVNEPRTWGVQARYNF